VKALFAAALLVRLAAALLLDTPGDAAGLTAWEWGGEASTLAEALSEQSPDWRKAENIQTNKIFNKELDRRLDAVYRIFQVKR
jgi:hypothetical protein